MRLLPATLVVALTALATLGTAQETRTETVRTTDGTQTKITSRESGMYGGTKSEKADAYYMTAQKAHKARDLETAEKNYLKAIKEDREFVEAYDNLGQVYRQMEKFDKAIEYYKRSLELYPQGNMARMNIAVVYSLQGNHNEAKAQYEALIQYQPDDAEGYFGLANTSMVLGDLETAEPNAKKALSIYEAKGSDHLADGYHLLGLIQHYRKEEAEARVNLQKAKDLGTRLHPTIEKEVFGNGTAAAPAQDPMRMETPEDYERLEPKVIAAFDWLLATPVKEDVDKRKQIGAFLLTWITGSPSVSIEISEGLVPYMEQPDCLLIFMGGYTKYALANKAGLKKEDAALYGTERVIEFYKANQKALGKNKEIDKLVALQEAGKLSSYIKDQL